MISGSNRPMALWGQGGSELVRLSSTFAEVVGLHHETVAATPLLGWIHPDDRAALEQTLEAGTGRSRSRHRTSAGDWAEFDWDIRTSDSEVVVLGLLSESTAAGQIEPADVSEITTISMTRKLDRMALIVEAKNPGLKCSILLVDPGQDFVTVGAGPSLPTAYNNAVEGLKLGPAVGSCGAASYWNVPIIVEDIGQDPLWGALRHEAELADLSACWSHPVTSSAGVVLGAMALYSSETSRPERHHLDGLAIAAQMVGLAIERERLEQSLAEAAKTEAITQLAGGIAHDFNNLLAAVLGNAELASERLSNDTSALPMLADIVTAATNATELCNQLLTYAGQGSLVAVTLDCNALVRDLGGLLQVSLSKKASLHLELGAEAATVFGDRGQLGQVVMNLLTNASDAIGENEGSVVVGTTLVQFTGKDLSLKYPNSALVPGDYVEIWVRDTGPGMTQEVRTKMFDPFFTTKSRGRGLGLAAVQGIVNSHGGEIAATSPDGGGTTVSVLLPRVEVQPEVDRAAATRTSPEPARVLVVDDDAMVRDVFVQVLQDGGYEVISAHDGQEAVDIYRRESDSIDCVLLDLSMPRLGGEEALEEIRVIRPDACVILTSGYAQHEILTRFAGLGLAGFLHKPAPIRSVREAVANALATHHGPKA